MALLLALLCTTISVVTCIGGQGATEYRTRHGIRVYSREEITLSRELVEMSTEAVITEARRADRRYTASKISGLRECSIELVGDPFPCGYVPTGLCSGAFYLHDCRIKVAARDGCAPALPHELIHALNFIAEDRFADRIQPHSSSKWFRGPRSVLERVHKTLGTDCYEAREHTKTSNDE